MFKSLFKFLQGLFGFQGDETDGIVASVTSLYEKNAMRGAAGRKIPLVQGVPRPVDQDGFVAWFDLDTAAVGEKDALLEQSQVLKKSDRRRVRAAGSKVVADAMAKLVREQIALCTAAADRLADVQSALAHLATRGLSRKALRNRKIAFGLGEIVGTAVGLSIVFDVPIMWAIAMSSAIGVAQVTLGSDLGSEAKLAAERHRFVRNKGLTGEASTRT